MQSERKQHLIDDVRGCYYTEGLAQSTQLAPDAQIAVYRNNWNMGTSVA
jgi:hypothetical protein